MDKYYPETVPYFLDEWQRNVNEGPDKLFLTDDVHPRGITRRETDELSARVYAWLKQKGVCREDFVLVCLPRGVLIPIAMMGVWKAGAAVTVVEDTYAAERISFIKKDCACRAVIDMNAWEEIAATEPLFGFVTPDDHDAALAVYTSGTTGNPKGVVHEYGNFKMHLASKTRKDSANGGEPVGFAFIAPLNFVAFYKNMISAIVTGMHLYVVAYATVKNPVLLRGYLEENRIKATFLSPSMIRAMNGKLPSCVKAVYTGSEPANGVKLDGALLLNVYGMSESFFSVAEFPITKRYDVCPVGKPAFGGIKIRLLDENGNEVKDGETGEVCVETPYFRGYLNLPEQTAKALVDGVFHTGDLAKRNENGDLLILGRNNDMIKINGNRIEPAEIESVAKRVLGIEWAAAKGFVKPERSFICLYYTANINVVPEDARERMKEFLPYYMIPSFFTKIDKPPLLPNGKLDKKALPEPDFNSYRREYEAPANDMEKRIVKSFEEALGMEKLSVNDDFYDMGGDSLRSIQAVAIAEEPLFTVPLLYQYRTARKIANAVLEKKAAEGKSVDHRNTNALEHDQPLIPMQLFLMDNQLFNPKSTFCNVPVLFRMPKEQVDLERLLEAFRKVIRNQPVLQSVIRVDPDFCFVQHYDPNLMPELTVEKLTEEEMETVKDELIQPFNMVNRLLYRLRFFETERFVYVFMDIHHLFNDGTSMNILIKNISAAYNGRDLPKDYAYLFARDSNKWVGTEEYERAKNTVLDRYGKTYWTRHISTDRESSSMHCSSVSEELPASDGQLEKYLSDNGLSLNALCVMAALCTLRDYEKKNDIMVTWAYSGRDDLTFKDTVFPLTKEFPVAVSFDKLNGTAGLMREVKEQIQLGVACQQYPYVANTTTIEVNNPFRVRTLGTMRQFSGIEGMTCEPVPIVNKGAACGLMNIQILAKKGGGQELRLTYSDTKYDKKTAETVLDIFHGNIKKLMG